MPIQPLTLTASHLGCSRDERLLFKPIHFTLESGMGLMVEGPNGIGKTTLLRVLATLLPPLCGEIKCNIPMRENIAYLGPHNGVKALLTPLEYLKYFAVSFARHCEGSLTRNDKVLEQLQLAQLKHKPCAQLSSGQKQRVALARIVLSNALIWILDEPMTALDQAGEGIFAQLLKTHLDAGKIAIIASHQALTEDRLQKIRLEP